MDYLYKLKFSFSKVLKKYHTHIIFNSFFKHETLKIVLKCKIAPKSFYKILPTVESKRNIKPLRRKNKWVLKEIRIFSIGEIVVSSA